MGVRLVGKIAAALVRVAGVVTWCLLGLWTALAVFFNVPLSVWPAAILALAIVLLYASALRDRWFVRGRPSITGWALLRAAAALVVTVGWGIWYFGYMRPNPNEEWIPKHARMPHVTIEGDKVHVSNVRNFTWRSETDFTPAYYDRVYDASTLSSMYLVLSPILQLDEIAHVWVCYGFSDGQAVAISVEARGVQGKPYRLLGSMFRQHQLIYVVGDERDVVGLRGAIWNSQVRFYPLRASLEIKRALFLDMMRRAHKLEEEPEFYNLFTNNCLNNVTSHVRRLGTLSLPSELRLLLTGFSDRLAFEYGFLDTDLPFDQAHVAYRIDEWIRQTALDEGFSRRLRENLRRQGADRVP